EIDVLPPVGADEARTPRRLDEDGVSPHGAERAHGAVHASREDGFGSAVQLLGSRVAHGGVCRRNRGRVRGSGSWRCGQLSRRGERGPSWSRGRPARGSGPSAWRWGRRGRPWGTTARRPGTRRAGRTLRAARRHGTWGRSTAYVGGRSRDEA